MSKKDTQFKSGKQAEKLGRLGGSKSTLAKRLCKIKYCTSKCPIFPCTFQPLSKNYKYRGKDKCALKMQTPVLQKKFYKLCSGGEVEFFEIMNEALVKVAGSKDLIKYGCMVHKMRFGDKSRNEVKLEDPIILQIQEAFQEYEKELKKKK